MYDTYEENSTYFDKENLQKKERAITPNPSIKKFERTEQASIHSIENVNNTNKYTNFEKSYKRSEYQENKVENKERAVINFNNSLNNSVEIS